MELPSKRKTRVPIEEIRKRVPPEVELDETTYNGVHSKCRFIDKDFGEFWAVAKDVFAGHGHRKRGNMKVSLAKTAKIKNVISRLPSFIKIDEATYCGKNKPARFIDEKFGEFWANPKMVEKCCGLPHGRMLEMVKNTKLTESDIKARLPPFITMLDDCYFGLLKTTMFFDLEYGEWMATPDQVLRGIYHPERSRRNRRKTNMRIYGVSSPSQCPEVRAKQVKGMRKTITISHWKTGELLSCTGTYEVNVVSRLNEDCTEFDWQIPFTMPSGKVYYCDLYLPIEDKYVEIKGYWMQQVSKDKWEWFHKTYPNSELWDRDRLKSLGYSIR